MNLQAQQQLLLLALYGPWNAVQANQDMAFNQAWPQGQYLRGLQAYRANADEMAKQVLASAFPTLKRLMGEESFNGLAMHFWRTHPSRKGDLAQWGEGLESFLRGMPALMQHEPHLPDVVALDWAMHLGRVAVDSATDAPVPLTLIESQFPIVDMQHGKNFEDLSDKEKSTGQRALVYRQGFKTACISIPKDAQI